MHWKAPLLAAMQGGRPPVEVVVEVAFALVEVEAEVTFVIVAVDEVVDFVVVVVFDFNWVVLVVLELLVSAVLELGGFLSHEPLDER